MSLQKLHSLFASDIIKIYAEKKLHDPENIDITLIEMMNDLGIMELPDYFYDYILYLSDPGNHNYPLLRKFLFHYSYDVLAPSLTAFLTKESFYHSLKDKVLKIYDLGCGHSGYWKMINAAFPKAQIIGIDKCPKYDSETDSDALGKFYMTDAFRLACSSEFKKELDETGETVIIFLSDILHCKIRNISILREFEKTHVLINEQLWDPYLNHRLNSFGGGLVDPDLFRKDYYHVRYYSNSHYYAYKEAGKAK